MPPKASQRRQPVPPAREHLEGLIRIISSRRFLVATLALAAVLRLAHVFALRGLPLFERLILDSENYDRWAREIAAGAWLGTGGAFYFDPLYPYALAGLYGAFGHDLLLVRLVQVALGVATCLLVAIIGRQVAGRFEGNLAALLLAAYKPSIFQEGEIEKTALGVFLATAMLACGLRRTLFGAAAAGAALALAVLARGNLLLMLPFGVLHFLVARAPEGSPASEPPTWRRRLTGPPGRNALAFVAAFFVTTSPVALRNHAVSGEWVLTTSQFGQNLYTGNNPANSTGGFQYVPFVRPQTGHEEEDFRAEAERRLGRPVGAREASDFWVARTWEHVRAEPLFAAQVLASKFVLFWSDYELPDGWDMYFLAQFSWPLRIPLLGMGLLLPLALVGVLASRTRAQVRPLVGYVALYAASVVLFFVFARYRLHVVPPMAVLAALGLRAILDWSRSPRAWPAAGVAATAIAASALSFQAMTFFGVEREEKLQSFVHLAGLYVEAGDVAAATAVLDRAVERAPHEPAVLCAFGELHLRSGHPREALPYFNKCLAARPTYPDAWYYLGATWEHLGARDEAVEAFRRQLAITPSHSYAKQRLMALTAP